MRGLLASGVARERLLYLNFEDDRLSEVRVGEDGDVHSCVKNLKRQ